MTDWEAVSGIEFADTICRALDLEPTKVGRIIIDARADEPGPARVYVEMYGSRSMLDLDWSAGLKGAEIKIVDREEG